MGNCKIQIIISESGFGRLQDWEGRLREVPPMGVWLEYIGVSDLWSVIGWGSWLKKVVAYGGSNP